MEHLLVGGASMAQVESDDDEELDMDDLPEELARAQALFTRPGYLQAALSALDAVSGRSVDELVAMGIERAAATLLKDGQKDVAAATAALVPAAAAAAAAAAAGPELTRESSSTSSHGIGGMFGGDSEEESEAAGEAAAAEPAPAAEPAERDGCETTTTGQAEAKCRAKYEAMDLDQLRRHCAESWLSEAGTKEEMTQRLVDYEKPAGGWPSKPDGPPRSPGRVERSASIPAEESAARAKYLAMSVDQLREQCLVLERSVEGSKADLVERLVDTEREAGWPGGPSSPSGSPQRKKAPTKKKASPKRQPVPSAEGEAAAASGDEPSGAGKYSRKRKSQTTLNNFQGCWQREIACVYSRHGGFRERGRPA